MGGFECADHINRSGERINLLEETEHHIRAEEDYKLLVDLGIKVVREGVCWSKVEKSPRVFDFTDLEARIAAAKALDVQIIWDLCHFGYPEGLVPTHPLFSDRFKSLCKAFALFHRSLTSKPLFVVPINEISFLSWHSGDMRGTVPFAINSGFDIKYHLCRAAIEGIKVLKETDPHCMIMLVEPLVKVHAANDEISNADLEILNSHQYQAMDIIAGKICQELGGSPDLFDFVGLNYYYNNQWDNFNRTLPWPCEDKRLAPLSKLLLTAYYRYNKPLVLSETGHFGNLRARWLEEITLECNRALYLGIDLRGICIYPVIDRPDWDDLTSYSNCGIWDLDPYKKRIPHPPSVDTVLKCVRFMETNNRQDFSLVKDAY